MRIVFLGTPEFAVASLKAMLDAGFDVVGVVTAPDKPAGRGMHLQQSAVKKFAVEKGLRVLQPEKLKDPEFLEALRSLKADLQVVIAFRMLPEVVWNMPPLGTINLHASLLPDYRGAAPINRAIMNGETVTGVSTFFLKHEIDTGDILLKATCPIGPDTNASELHDTLMELGAQLMVESLHKIETGSTQGTPQGPPTEKTAPKIFREDCLIHWDQSGTRIHNHIRGLSPYPAAHTIIGNKQVKVFQDRFEPAIHQLSPGTVETDGKTFLRMSCNDGWIYLLDVQMESKKRMLIEELLRGWKP